MKIDEDDRRLFFDKPLGISYPSNQVAQHKICKNKGRNEPGKCA